MSTETGGQAVVRAQPASSGASPTRVTPGLFVLTYCNSFYGFHVASSAGPWPPWASRPPSKQRPMNYQRQCFRSRRFQTGHRRYSVHIDSWGVGKWVRRAWKLATTCADYPGKAFGGWDLIVYIPLNACPASSKLALSLHFPSREAATSPLPRPTVATVCQSLAKTGAAVLPLFLTAYGRDIRSAIEQRVRFYFSICTQPQYQKGTIGPCS